MAGAASLDYLGQCRGWGGLQGFWVKVQQVMGSVLQIEKKVSDGQALPQFYSGRSTFTVVAQFSNSQ